MTNVRIPAGALVLIADGTKATLCATKVMRCMSISSLSGNSNRRIPYFRKAGLYWSYVRRAQQITLQIIMRELFWDAVMHVLNHAAAVEVT